MKGMSKVRFYFTEPSYKSQKTFIGFLSNIYTSKETLSEKIRLLYVALTRAKELMVVIHSTNEDGEPYKTFEKSSNLKQLLLQSTYYDQKRLVVEPEYTQQRLSESEHSKEVKYIYSLHEHFYKLIKSLKLTRLVK